MMVISNTVLRRKRMTSLQMNLLRRVFTQVENPTWQALYLLPVMIHPLLCANALCVLSFLPYVVFNLFVCLAAEHKFKVWRSAACILITCSFE